MGEATHFHHPRRNVHPRGNQRKADAHGAPGPKPLVPPRRSALALAVAPRRVPSAREPLDPNRAPGGPPFPVSPDESRIPHPVRGARRVQAVHYVRIRDRPRGAEVPPEACTAGEEDERPVPATPDAEGGESIVPPRPGDGAVANPDPRDGGRAAHPPALRVAPVHPPGPHVGARVP